MKRYYKPEVEIIKFETEDVLNNSETGNTGGQGQGGGVVLPDDPDGFSLRPI